MSTTIDQQVVEMRFDNRHFENNVSNTMSTLDKLRDKLNLSGATKGFDEINTSVKNVNMNPLGSAVETVTAKFSALQVMGVTALANITNSAVNAGKNIVRSLTIAPVTTGFNEYELKMGSIQTIMAGTGESLDTVNRYLNELNEYSDKTIYSFKDMTSNIGKFTNAGVKLEDAVLAIKGISNEAALSGANANEASRAMYNFSQALSSGFVKLIDWKSIELANMATKDFKEQLIQTAVEVGTLKKGADGMYDVANVISKANATSLNATKNFNDSLGNQWMTTEVLIETLRKYADETTDIGAKASAAATEVKTFSMMMDTLKESAQSGWAQTWELLVGDFEEAKAFFTELSGIFGDIIGESADRRNNLIGGALTSNWDKLIDKINEAGITTEKFEEAIRRRSGSETFVDPLIEKYGSLEKAIREGALSSDILRQALDDLTGTGANSTIAKFVDGLKEIKRILKFGHVGDDVKKLQTALDALGYDLGAPGIDGIIGPITEAAIKAFQEANGLVADGIAGPETLAALEKAGQKVGELEGDVDSLKKSCNELIDEITKKGGRELLLESLLNIIKAIRKPLSAVTKAMRKIFDVKPTQLYSIIEGLTKFTRAIIINDATAEKLQRTFEGLFALFKIFADIAGGGLRLAFKVLMTVLEKFDMGILDFTASIGDALVNVSNFISDIIDGALGELIDWVIPKIEEAIESAKEWAKSIKETEVGKNVLGALEKWPEVLGGIALAFGGALEAVKKWLDEIGDAKIVKDVCKWFEDAAQKISDAATKISGKISEFNVSGFATGLYAIGGFLYGIGNTIANSKFVTTIVDGICKAFEKLKTFFGSFKLPEFSLDNTMKFFQNLVKVGEKIEGTGGVGVGAALGGIGQHLKDNVISWNWDVFKEKALEKFVNFWLKVGDKVKAAFEVCKEVAAAITKFIFGTEKIDLPTILGVTKKFLEIIVLIKALQVLNTMITPLDNITDALNNVASSLKWKAIGDAFKSMALVLAAFTVCLVVISSIPFDKAWKSAALLAGLMVVLGIVISAIVFFVSKIPSESTALDMVSSAGALLMLIGSVLLLVYTIKSIDKLELKNPGKTFLILAGTLLAMSAGVKMIAKAAGSSFRSVAAILTLVGALKLILDVIDAYDKHDWSGQSDAIMKMVQMLFTLSAAINIASRGVKANASAKGLAALLLAMVISLKILLGVIEDFAAMDDGTLKKGGAAVVGLLGVMTVMLSVISAFNKGNVIEKGQKSVNNFAGLALALVAVIAAIWVLGHMDLNTLKQGGLAVSGILLLFTGMLAAVGKSSSGLKIGSILTMMIAMGVLMAEMAVIIHTMKGVPLEQSVGSATALGMMMLAMAGVLRVLTKRDVKFGNIVKWTGGMLALSGVMVILSEVLRRMDGINSTNAIGNVVALGLLLAEMAGVLHILTGLDMRKLSPNKMTKLGLIFVGMSIILAGLAAVLLIMRNIDSANGIGGAIALGVLLSAMSGVLYILMGLDMRKLSPNKMTKLGLIFAGMGLILAELAVVLLILKDVNPANALGNVFALGVLLGAMAGVLIIIQALKVNWSSLQGIVVLAAMAAVLGTLVFALSKITGIDTARENAITLANLAIVLSLCTIPLAVASLIAPAATAGVISLVAMAAMLGLLIWHLANIKDAATAQTNAITLANLAIVLSLCTLPLALASVIAPVAIVGAGLLVALAAVLALLVLGLSKIDNVDTARANADIIIDLINTMTSMIVQIGSLGFDALTAVAAIGGFILVVDTLGDLAARLGKVASSNENLENFLDVGLELFKKLAKGVGEMISDFGVGLTTGLPAIAENLSSFAKKLGTFVSVMGDVDDDIITRAKNLAEAIKMLISGDFLNSLSKLTGGSLSTMGEELSSFAENSGKFIEAMSGMKDETAVKMDIFAKTVKTLNDICAGGVLDTNSLSNFGSAMETFAGSIKTTAIALSDLTDADVENIKRAATAGEAMADLNRVIPRSGGDLQSIIGEKDLAVWGTKISAFADSLVAYSAKVSGKNIDSAAITKSAEAATSVSDLNAAIPKQGGIWQTLAGAQDLATWGVQITTFADALVSYSGKVSGGTIDPAAITKSAEAASALAEVNNAIPTDGGVWQWLAGGKDMTAFGTGLTGLADGLLDYSAVAVQIDDDKIKAIERTGTAVDKIKAVVEKLPSSGGIASWFGGDIDPIAFGDGLTALANGINRYCRVAATINQADLDAITFSQNAVSALVSLVQNTPYVDADKLTLLKTAVDSLHSVCVKLNTISTAGYDFSGTSTLKTEIGKVLGILTDISVSDVYADFGTLSLAVDEVAKSASNLAGLNGYTYGGVDTLKGALNSLSEANIDGVISAFSGKAESMQAAVSSLVTAMTTGLSGGSVKMSETMAEVVNAAIEKAKSKTKDFRETGISFGANMSNGIKDRESIIQNSGKTLGSKAVTGAREKYSRMYAAGKYLGDGLVTGIEDKWDDAYDAGYALGQAAVQGEKDGQQSKSPSKLTILAGKWLGEGLILGMDQMGGKVYKAGSTLGEAATGTISSTVSKIASAINTDIDAQPTIRPVLDLSDVQSGASAISSLLGGTASVGVNANLGAISSMMNSRGQNGSNNEVVSALDKLSKKMDGLGNTTYNVNGVTYDDGSNVSVAVKDLARAIKLERRT